MAAQSEGGDSPLGTLSEAIRARAAIQEEIKAHDESAKRERAKLEAKLCAALFTERLLGARVDAQAVARGLEVIQIGGPLNRLDVSVVEDAKLAIAEGGGQLFRNTLAIKDYDRWSGQRCDPSYGMCPSHGYVVFSIELTRRAYAARQLLDQEIEDALYVLANLASILEARESLKKEVKP